MLQFRNVLVLCAVLGLFLVAMPLKSHAQEQNQQGFLGKLFNKSDSGASKPIFLAPGKSAGSGGGGNPSKTGVARSGNRSGSTNNINYRRLSKGKEPSMSEIIAQSSNEQSARTRQFVEERKAEAARMAEIYQQQMRERLAAQSNDPSATQAFGGGGSGGMHSGTARRMVYDKDKNEGSGKKPIRLFNVR